MNNIHVNRNLLDKFYIFQEWLSSFLLFFVCFLVAVQVVLRYVFHSPLFGIEELVIFPVIWLYMLGAANASHNNSHIQCGMLTLLTKNESFLRIFEIIKQLIIIIILFLLVYINYGYFMYSLKVWKTSQILVIPLFYAESALFIGVVLMLIYHINNFVTNYFRKN